MAGENLRNDKKYRIAHHVASVRMHFTRIVVSSPVYDLKIHANPTLTTRQTHLHPLVFQPARGDINPASDIHTWVPTAAVSPQIYQSFLEHEGEKDRDGLAGSMKPRCMTNAKPPICSVTLFESHGESEVIWLSLRVNPSQKWSRFLTSTFWSSRAHGIEEASLA
ncbi:hypothetical protein TWF694_011922 [Orbilia ellipsospora]|uniref:Uncharacterized protein n=1 Tax=Orbilia ellipsospora TaxID=2528407 RepID=A0AAV9XNB3_9PEZI